jgi:hypothetical protein
MEFKFKTITDIKKFLNLSGLDWDPSADYKTTGNIETNTICGKKIVRHTFGRFFTLIPTEHMKRKDKILANIEKIEEEMHRCYDIGYHEDLCPYESDLAKLYTELHAIERDENALKHQISSACCA